MYEQAHQWQAVASTLSTPHYHELDALLPQHDRDQFMQHLNWSDPASMDAAMCWFTRRIVDVLQHKAIAHNEVIPIKLVERHLAFISDELGINQ